MSPANSLRRPPPETPALYAQDGQGYEAIVHAHYFVGANDWWVTEYDPENDRAFGFVCLNNDAEMAELGYFLMAELEAIRAPLGPVRVLPVEFDNHWQQTTLRLALQQKGIIR